MIDKITIKNFKSVVDLELNLGRFNVLIGENGCGKSNILEGIAVGSAAFNFLLKLCIISKMININYQNTIFILKLKKQ